MKLTKLLKYFPEPNYNPRPKKYLCIRVKLSNNTYRWYRLSKKVSYACYMYQKQNGKLPYDILINALINVPVTPYFGNNHAVISLGQIKQLKYKKLNSYLICSRSQFVPYKSLKNNFKQNYDYLKHDYGKYSRLNIYLSLWYFTRGIKK